MLMNRPLIAEAFVRRSANERCPSSLHIHITILHVDPPSSAPNSQQKPETQNLPHRRSPLPPQVYLKWKCFVFSWAALLPEYKSALLCIPDTESGNETITIIQSQ